MSLSQQRCLNHGTREAVALCLSCRHHFCRECVTEHSGRVICASCLRRVAASAPHAPRRLAGLARSSSCAAGVLAAWLFFYLVGQVLLALPASFHEGTFWKEKVWGE